MNVTIRDVEDAFLLGSVAEARWMKEFQGQFMAPVGIALLGMTLAELKRNPAKAANVPPEALAKAKELFIGLTKKNAAPPQPQPSSARWNGKGASDYGPPTLPPPPTG